MEVNFKFGQGPNLAVRVWRYSRWEENAKCIEEQKTWGENNHACIHYIGESALFTTCITIYKFSKFIHMFTCTLIFA